MRARIIACIFSGLAIMCLTANAEDTPEYASVPPVDDCHYAEHPMMREKVHNNKYRHITHRHTRVHHKFHIANDLAVYFPFSSPSYYDSMWPSDGCHCEGNGYAISSLSSDELAYNIMYYSPLYEARSVAAPCDLGSEE